MGLGLALALAIPALAQEGPQWAAKVSGDYFRFDSDFTTTTYNTGGGDKGTRSGDSYGATVSLRAPFMGKDDWLDLSYRQGSLSGSIDIGNVDITATSDISEFAVLYKLGVYAHKNKQDVTDVDFSVGIGFSLNHWENEEVLPPTWFWTATGTRGRTSEMDMYLLNIVPGLGWTFLNLSGDTVTYRLGVRGDVILRVGLATYSDQAEQSDLGLAYGGRAKLYNDLTFSQNAALFVEGGWQYIGFMATDYTDNVAESYYGPYARAGFAFFW